MRPLLTSPRFRVRSETPRRVAWIVATTVLVFVLRLAAGSGVGVAFLFVVPIGLAAWWFGRGVALAVAAVCLALKGVAIAAHPVEDAALSLLVRGAVFAATAVVVSELR